MQDNSKIEGHIHYQLYGESGELKSEGFTHNLVVTEGDQWVANKLYGGTQGAIIQMVLGTSGTAPAKSDTWVNGAFANNGAAAGTAGSVAVGTIPGTLNGIRYLGTFGAGYATQNGIAEVVLSNVTPGTAGTEPATGQILGHGLLSPTVNKGANDQLVVTYDVTFLGA